MMDDEVPLMVGQCGHFFEQDEYEMVSASLLLLLGSEDSGDESVCGCEVHGFITFPPPSPYRPAWRRAMLLSPTAP